jgi:asparagine synthase (glutamine-hydrolysing)
MTGFSAVLRGPESDLGGLREGLGHTGQESVAEYTDEACSVCVVTHDDAAEDQPATAADGDVLVWVWGDLFGRDDGRRYVRRSELAPGLTDAAYCAHLFDRFGTDFPVGLNGEFAGCLYDREAGTVSVFTDRTGLRPVYHTTTDAGEVVVTTELQALPTYPTVETELVLEYVYEYLTLRRSFGLRTPLAGVERVPPGSFVTVDLGTGERTTTRYWYPRYEPVDRPFRYFLDRFTDRFLDVLDERVDEECECGLLLSGGADSRLILAGLRALGREPVTYHMNEWMNDEARIAERVASTAGAEFRFLRRDADYQSRALERNTELTEYISWFDQAHANGFAEELREECDLVVGGEYSAETVGNFKDFPTHSVRTGFGLVHLPVRKRVDTVAAYLDHIETDLPTYLESPPTLREILDANVSRDGSGIDHHGVRYESLEDLVVFSELYPTTNDTDHLNYRGTSQVVPHWTPFLDGRILEFTRTYPHAYRLRRKIVNQAVKRLDPELAAIPYANTGVPLGYPFYAHFAADRLQQFRQRNLPSGPSRTPVPHYTHGSWPDNAELLRHRPLVEETLAEKADLIDRLPFLDEAGIRRCYREHLDGANNADELFTLLTFLRMPVTERVVGDAGTDPGPGSGGAPRTDTSPPDEE